MAKITNEYKAKKVLKVDYVHNINDTEIIPTALHSLPGVKIM